MALQNDPPASTRAVDPITLEVIRNRLDVIADEMESALVLSAFSFIIKEGADCSCALFNSLGDTIAQAVALPQHLGVLASTVKSILRERPIAGMQEDDIYIMNDPYDGGTHVPDLTVLMPIFWQGRVVALSACIAHQSDMGGMVVGSLPPDATEIYQEGLRLPPIKLMAAGDFDQQILSIILMNVRMPEHSMADMRAQIAACRTGGERIRALCSEYGDEVLLAAIDELMDRAEMITRARIAEMPDGEYSFTDYIDNDGVVLDKQIKLHATLTIKGSEILVDFTGTDPTVLGAANASFSHGACITYYCVRCVTDPSLPNNAGCFRPIKVHLPENTIVNPRHPAALNARTMTVCRMVDIIFACLAQAVPDRVRSCSSSMEGVSLCGRRRADRSPFVYVELFCGGMGARPTKDGVDYIETDITNMRNTPTEALEMEFPLLIRSCRLRQDSGGAGHFRGGLGLEKIFEVIDDEAVEVTHRGDRHFTRPWGFRGGHPAAPWSTMVTRNDRSQFKVPARLRFAIHSGEVMECYTGGGGGYGDPLLRPASAVLDDVLDRKVSLAAAERDYGVVIDPTSMTVDSTATARRRADLRTKRGEITWLFDRGELGRS